MSFGMETACLGTPSFMLGDVLYNAKCVHVNFFHNRY